MRLTAEQVREFDEQPSEVPERSAKDALPFAVSQVRKNHAQVVKPGAPLSRGEMKAQPEADPVAHELLVGNELHLGRAAASVRDYLSHAQTASTMARGGAGRTGGRVGCLRNRVVERRCVGLVANGPLLHRGDARVLRPQPGGLDEQRVRPGRHRPVGHVQQRLAGAGEGGPVPRQPSDDPVAGAVAHVEKQRSVRLPELSVHFLCGQLSYTVQFGQGGEMDRLVFDSGLVRLERFLNPLRKALFSKLPIELVHHLTLYPAVVLWLGLQLGVGRIAYFKLIRQWGFRQLRSVVFDQMLPRIANYWAKSDVDRLMRESGLQQVELAWVNEMSWCAVGTKP